MCVRLPEWQEDTSIQDAIPQDSRAVVSNNSLCITAAWEEQSKWQGPPSNPSILGDPRTRMHTPDRRQDFFFQVKRTSDLKPKALGEDMQQRFKTKIKTLLSSSASLSSPSSTCFPSQSSLANKHGLLTQSCINTQCSQSGKTDPCCERSLQTSLPDKDVPANTVSCASPRAPQKGLCLWRGHCLWNKEYKMGSRGQGAPLPSLNLLYPQQVWS